jgi:hypothetical protein
LGFFWVLFGVPRRFIEEGGHLVCFMCAFGGFIGCATSYEVGLNPIGRGVYSKNNLWRARGLL